MCYNENMKISLKKLGIVLAAVLGGLFVAHVIVSLTLGSGNEFGDVLLMDQEQSLFTWWSQCVLLFLPALGCFYVAWGKKRAGAPFVKSWIGVGVVLMFLSLDDGATLHEKLSTVAKAIGLQHILSGGGAWFEWSWWVIFLALFIIVAIFFVKWFVHLPRRTKILFAVGVGLALVGQVGLEAVNSYLNATSGYNLIFRGVEKLVGRGGLSIFLWSLADYVRLLPARERPALPIEVVK
jgi:hypothetical protein